MSVASGSFYSLRLWLIQETWLQVRQRHPSWALSRIFVHDARIPGLYADGDGLYLKVDGLCSKWWILRTMVQGKRRGHGLGSCTEISLLVARARAQRLRKIARQGCDPFDNRERVFSTCHPEVTKPQARRLTCSGRSRLLSMYSPSPSADAKGAPFPSYSV